MLYTLHMISWAVNVKNISLLVKNGLYSSFLLERQALFTVPVDKNS